MDGALPVDAVLDALKAALYANTAAVLQAPPGAGKTTRVPLALIDKVFAASGSGPGAKPGKIVILEPRRLAARAAANRMAQICGEALGDTIGLRARLQSRTGPNNRIEVVTEGVFTRMIMDDPSLEGIACVIFDEFHERSLDADLGLALALDAQAGLRDDLRILVMSATLDGARVAGLLGNAPIIESRGRAYPVETIYVHRDSAKNVEDAVCETVVRALREETGSILAFLPGQGEIRRAANMLADRIGDEAIVVAPLYGAMDRVAQDRAINPPAAGQRKVVLATAIAETSLTIEGVRIVIDCGLARIPRYEPGPGLTRLETVRVSQASADQRRGRAGRTEPGVCYRLWEEAATRSLAPFSQPEILAADLSALVLDLAQWGVRDPLALCWLDPPPQAALTEASLLLQQLGALSSDGAITATGRAIRALPLAPRLGRMVIEAAKVGNAVLAADIAAVLVERGVGGNDVDISRRVENMRRDRSRRARDVTKLAEGWAERAQTAVKSAPETASTASISGRDCGTLLALAYPDRIAKARGAPGTFLMANGRAAKMDDGAALARSGWLTIADISGRAAGARILAAAEIAPGDVEAIAAGSIEEVEETSFDRTSATIRRRQLRRFGAIALQEQPLPVEGSDAAAVLASGIAALGIERLPWSKAHAQTRDRVRFLRETTADAWPDLSDRVLAEKAVDWLAPFIEGRGSLAAITVDDLGKALAALLPWPAAQHLDEQAPTHFKTPAGSEIALDYGVDGRPLLRVRVQELYGLNSHPAIAGGRIPLTLELLSPAQRPIQITRDLPGFWQGSWAEVRADMKGRYPKHVWPDDPAHAAATRRAKPRG